MSWFNSWSDFTTKASEFAKSASEKASEVAKEAADKSKVLASSVHDKVNKFVEEQKKEYSAVEQETDLSRRKTAKKQQMMQSGHTPWWIDPDKNTEQLELYDELKVNILKLCEDENNFLIKAPSSSSVFEFNLEYALPHAHCALNDDPILPQIRFKLVPRKLTEEQFWKNYFYRVNVIRESLGCGKVDFSKPPLPGTPRTPSANTQNITKSSTEEAMDIKDDKDDKEVIEDQNEDNNLENKGKESSQSRSKSKEVIEPTKDELSDNGIKMDLSNSLIKMPSSEQITQMTTENVSDIHDIDEDEDFLADDIHIDALSDIEKAKMKKELGIDPNDIDVENVDDLLAEVGADDIEDMSDGELEAELENM